MMTLMKKAYPATAAFTLSPTSLRFRYNIKPPLCQKISFHSSYPHVAFMVGSLVDDATQLDHYLVETASSSSVGLTPIQEFEPIINFPAAISFLIIFIVFALLQLRINAVASAAKRRSFTLDALRKAESLQLSASDVGINSSERPTSKDVMDAKNEYEAALREELDLRTILPGVRIVAPNDPKRQEEERAAAKRFLGWDWEEFENERGDGSSNYELMTNNNKKNQGDSSEKAVDGLSNGAKLILLGVASMLILLLWTLSFDPMTADQIFSN